MGSELRRLALTAHVMASVGWLGAVAAALALGVVGAVSDDAQTVRAAYVALEPIAWFLLVPLALASFVTGLVQSLGTAWGLFRHYWVLAKLIINVFATIVLLLYTRTIAHLADVAAETSSPDELDELRDVSPALHAGAALLLLGVATFLAIYKPRGITAYGWRKERERLQRR